MPRQHWGEANRLPTKRRSTRRVLLVEDEELFGGTLAEELREDGFEVVEVQKAASFTSDRVAASARRRLA